MAIIDIVMPKMGESIMEATILNWNKKPGDHVEVDETILEVATDKVDSEVPAVAAGIIKEILFNEHDVVPVGTTIARMETEGEWNASQDEIDLLLEEEVETPEDSTEEDSSIDQQTEKGHQKGEDTSQEKKSSRFYSPLVLKIAQEEKVPLSELENLSGSGLGGRVNKNDILQYVEGRKKRSPEKASKEIDTAATVEESSKKASSTKSLRFGNVEIIEMDRMRKMIADHMVESKRISPHVTSFSEADVTNMVKWREKHKKEFLNREGEKLTYMPLFVEAIVKCIKQFPIVNSSVDGDKIVIKKEINIGMATALPNGNLIVPVIKNAEQLNLVGLAHHVNHLAQDARAGRLAPDATRSGTFTVTNVGTFGSLTGTPIINQPQVAILAIGTIKKRPMVVETDQGDSIAIRHMMYLSMSYDHRIVDGSLGSSFLTAVANELEHFDVTRPL